MSRQVVLDTETTGLEVEQGHRVIEIGCVELRQRRVTERRFHHYLNPDRAIDAGAQQVHGISSEMLADKPRFKAIAGQFLDFVRGAELLIHNADFDVGFLDRELELAGCGERIADVCEVVDTWHLARTKHPGQKNNLDALCRRYEIDNSNRELHGALLDSLLLAEVYLAMTGGQTDLGLDDEDGEGGRSQSPQIRALIERAGERPLPVVAASAEEIAAHEARLATIRDKAGGQCLWDRAGEGA